MCVCEDLRRPDPDACYLNPLRRQIPLLLLASRITGRAPLPSSSFRRERDRDQEYRASLCHSHLWNICSVSLAFPLIAGLEADGRALLVESRLRAVLTCSPAMCDHGGKMPAWVTVPRCPIAFRGRTSPGRRGHGVPAIP